MFSSFRQEQSKNILENQNKKVIKNKNTKEKNGSLQVSQTNKEKTVTGKKERRSGFIRTLDGVVTVEASFVLPFVLIALAAIMFLIEVVVFSMKVQFALYTTARTMSAYSYNIDDPSASLSDAAATVMVINNVGSEAINHANVIGNVAGIYMINSKILKDNKDIDLVASYNIRVPFDMLKLMPIHIVQRAKVRGFVGYDCLNDDDKDKDDEQIVYITRTGKVYHLHRDCTYIQPVVYTVNESEISSKRNESGAKYYRCEICEDTPVTDHNVYITQYGTAWHTDANCTAIKKGVQAIKISEIGNRTPCSKCGQ